MEQESLLTATVEDDDSGDDDSLLVPVYLVKGATVSFADLKFILKDPNENAVLRRELKDSGLPTVECQAWYADQSKYSLDGATMKIKSAAAELVFYNDGGVSTVRLPLRYASTYWPARELFVAFDGYEVNLNYVKRDSLCVEFHEDASQLYESFSAEEEETMRRANAFIIANVPGDDDDDKSTLAWRLYGDVPITVRPSDLVTLRCDSCLEEHGIILEVSAPASSITSFSEAGLWQGGDDDYVDGVFGLSIGPATDVDIPEEIANVQNVGRIARLVSKVVSKLFRGGKKAAKKTGKKAKKVSKSGVVKGAKSLAGEAVTATVLSGATTLGTEGARALVAKATAPKQQQLSPEEELEDAFEEEDDL